MESNREYQEPQDGSLRQTSRAQLPSLSDLGLFTLTRVNNGLQNQQPVDPPAPQYQPQTYAQSSMTNESQQPYLLLASPVRSWAAGPSSSRDQGPSSLQSAGGKPKLEVEVDPASHLAHHTEYQQVDTKANKEDGRSATSDFVRKLYK